MVPYVPIANQLFASLLLTLGGARSEAGQGICPVRRSGPMVFRFRNGGRSPRSQKAFG
jgi:hypothetical protein